MPTLEGIESGLLLGFQVGSVIAHLCVLWNLSHNRFRVKRNRANVTNVLFYTMLCQLGFILLFWTPLGEIPWLVCVVCDVLFPLSLALFVIVEMQFMKALAVITLIEEHIWTQRQFLVGCAFFLLCALPGLLEVTPLSQYQILSEDGKLVDICQAVFVGLALMYELYQAYLVYSRVDGYVDDRYSRRKYFRSPYEQLKAEVSLLHLKRFKMIVIVVALFDILGFATSLTTLHDHRLINNPWAVLGTTLSLLHGILLWMIFQSLTAVILPTIETKAGTKADPAPRPRRPSQITTIKEHIAIPLPPPVQKIHHSQRRMSVISYILGFGTDAQSWIPQQATPQMAQVHRKSDASTPDQETHVHQASAFSSIQPLEAVVVDNRSSGSSTIFMF